MEKVQPIFLVLRFVIYLFVFFLLLNMNIVNENGSIHVFSLDLSIYRVMQYITPIPQNPMWHGPYSQRTNPHLWGPRHIEG